MFFMYIYLLKRGRNPFARFSNVPNAPIRLYSCRPGVINVLGAKSPQAFVKFNK